MQAPAKENEGALHPHLGCQFRYLNDMADDFVTDRESVMSVDTRRKNLTGQSPWGGRSERRPERGAEPRSRREPVVSPLKRQGQARRCGQGPGAGGRGSRVFRKGRWQVWWSAPRSTGRTSGSWRRCRTITRIERATATRARCLPRRRTSRQFNSGTRKNLSVLAAAVATSPRTAVR